ncbi:zonular occludens toxin domain-containing protein [Xanthomonas translucens]|uniref:zonular occludens toxin domain-containing protein n=1 Tax=Xanthomonas campestris pv. translucens TaxID=343 RepID=UPI0007E43888|nr:zonular occludens toxin domain-containing protein [Xanthomonas translucens]OAX60810.1 zonular occludens toxin [Xanthomonas translucens pv. translucens]QSQ39461.1 zonular occludens toxin [Xanthomonas translucens pv. translucens]UKE59817.1 zonular occludens toxin domain-containing protein [Xanthomonas translucens pv. hordei]WIH02825.1 zonular occludens toxin domain-containing protein [Xanthomonas translucens pv. hordei]
MIGDTASISLLTGLPGSGKSLRMAEAISKLVEKGEHVYACNIDGLRIPGVTLWDDAKRWRELPVGAILFVDEAQAFFPERRGGEPPECVRMNKIRHDGIRIVLGTQQPNYLDTYLRGLIGYHEHLLRRDGRQESFLFRENQVMDVVRQKTATIKRNYDYQVYKFNAKYFKCYDSAQTHTIKYQMPALVKRALMILPVAMLLGAGAWYAVYRDTMFAKKDESADKTAPSGPSQAGSSALAPGGALKVDSGESYVASITPLVSDVPWSAPAFLNRPVVSDPHVYCMSTVNSCRCVTEQNTRVPAIRDDVCRDIARNGEPYNPFKAPSQRVQEAVATQESGQGSHEASAPRPASSAAVPGSVISKHPRVLGTFPESPSKAGSTYTPPTTLDM